MYGDDPGAYFADLDYFEDNYPDEAERMQFGELDEFLSDDYDEG